MQDSKRVLGFNCKKKIEQLNFFDWLWNVKNLVLWNGSELVRNVKFRNLRNLEFKKMSPRNKFLETLSFDLPAKITVLCTIRPTVILLNY